MELRNELNSVAQAAFAMPRALGHVEGQRFVLLVEALISVPHAADDLNIWFKTLEVAYTRWLANPDSQLVRADVDLLARDSAQADRVSILLHRERWAFGQGHGEPTGAWDAEITSGIRALRSATGPQDVVNARRPASLAPVHSAPPRRSIRQRIGSLLQHPTGSNILGGLVVAAVLAGVAYIGQRIVHGSTKLSLHEQGVTAWGPARPTVRCDERGLCPGLDHVALDSTINNPLVDDERYFLGLRRIGGAGPIVDKARVRPGDRVAIRIYVANSADVEPTGDDRLDARGVRVRLEIPRDPSSFVRVYGWLTAANAIPKEIFDSAVLVSDQPVALSMVPGSARLSNRAHPSGLRLADFSKRPVMIGYSQLNGRMSSCFCQSGYVTATLAVRAAR